MGKKVEKEGYVYERGEGGGRCRDSVTAQPYVRLGL